MFHVDEAGHGGKACRRGGGAVQWGGGQAVGDALWRLGHGKREGHGERGRWVVSEADRSEGGVVGKQRGAGGCGDRRRDDGGCCRGEGGV